jgi:putative ABC transport system permease protein
VDLLILKALAHEPAHGLGVSRRVAQMTGQTFDDKPGSLFPALHRLEARGWLESAWGESENRRRAKYYRLTAAGGSRRKPRPGSACPRSWPGRSARPDRRPMSFFPRLRAFVRSVLRRPQVDRDLAEELESYVDLVADEQQAHGAAAAEARRHARAALGSTAAVAEAVRSARAGAGLERLGLDLRHAVRSLRRAPAFTAMAGITITIGIAANTAVFSVIDAAAFKPLPYDDPDRLVEIATVLDRGTEDERRQIGITWRQLDEWREERAIFSAIETLGNRRPVTIAEGRTPGSVPAVRISPGMTRMLGVAPILGRGFVPDDTHPDVRVILLAESYWRAAFDGDRGIVGQVLTLDRVPYQVIGVLPATLAYYLGGRSIAVWLPLDERAERRQATLPFIGTIARVRPNLSLEQAERLLDAAAERRHVGMAPDVDLYPIDTHYALRENLGLTVAFAAVAVMLLIACANVANLLLARVMARRRETALRSALGATRGRLMRQLVMEGLALASLGGIGALVLAFWGTTVWPALIPPDLGLFAANLPAIDARSLAFCAGAVVLTGLLCSVLPALRAVSPDVVRALEGSGAVAGTTPAGRRLRLGLQAAQVALTVVLLSAAGLLAMSFMRMVRAEYGYEADRLAMASLALPATYTDSASRSGFFDDLLARVRETPGVRVAYGTPPASGSGGASLILSGREDAAGTGSFNLYAADPEYFSVAGIPLRAGRIFNAHDGPAAPEVALIDERAAERYWPGQSAIGQRIRLRRTSWPWMTVVGIVGHVKTSDFTEPGGTVQVYHPIAQSGSGMAGRYRTMIVRADDPSAALASIQTLARTMDPEVTVTLQERVSALYDDVFVMPRFYAIVMALVAGIGLVTAAVGLFAVLSYSVTERAREIGVRIALGAEPRRLRRLVVREALVPVAAGTLAGLAVCFWGTRLLVSLLYETSPLDIMTLGLVLLTIAAAAVAAAYVPARRATRLDPIAILRSD